MATSLTRACHGLLSRSTLIHLYSKVIHSNRSAVSGNRTLPHLVAEVWHTAGRSLPAWKGDQASHLVDEHSRLLSFRPEDSFCLCKNQKYYAPNRSICLQPLRRFESRAPRLLPHLCPHNTRKKKGDGGRQTVFLVRLIISADGLHFRHWCLLSA